MSVEAMEVLIIILAGVAIIGAVIEVWGLMIRHFARQREERRWQHEARKWMEGGDDEN